MKVISINAAKTINSEQIALNVDEELTPELVERIHYGVLEITGTGKVLLVKLPENSYTPFTAASVATLNGKLAEAKDELQRIEDKHQRMLQAISTNTGLPLG